MKFKVDFADILSASGFYTHMNVSSFFGWSFDIQACKDNICYQFECRTEATKIFKFNRIRPNQMGAVNYLEDCGCFNNYLVINFSNSNDIKLLPFNKIQGNKINVDSDCLIDITAFLKSVKSN